MTGQDVTLYRLERKIGLRRGGCLYDTGDLGEKEGSGIERSVLVRRWDCGGRHGIGNDGAVVMYVV